MSRYVCVHGRPLEEDDGAECCDCTIDALRARIAELEEGLSDMLKFFGNPKRDEWLTQESFEAAKRVEQNAKRMLDGREG